MTLLDDPGHLEAADEAGLLRAVASGAAQVREAGQLSADAGVGELAGEDRPRSVVVCGAGTSALVGDLVAAVAGPACPVPVLSHRGYGLPVWVGAADLVVAVSFSGTTAQTLWALEEAVRRGCRVLVVCAAGSPAEALGRRGRSPVVPVPQVRPAKASLWAVATPVLLAAGALGLLQRDGAGGLVEAAAAALEAVADRCRVDADQVVNPAKTLAASLEGTLPVVWGTSALAGVAARRLAGLLQETARRPALWGELPDVQGQLAVFDAAVSRDLFHDPFEDGPVTAAAPEPHLVLLRDAPEDPRAARLADDLQERVRERGAGVSALQAQGAAPVERLASLVGLAEYTAVYAALASGVDPAAAASVR